MDDQPAVDFLALAKANDELREVLAASVAGLVADGFTDREARAIIAGMWSSNVGSN